MRWKISDLGVTDFRASISEALDLTSAFQKRFSALSVDSPITEFTDALQQWNTIALLHMRLETYAYLRNSQYRKDTSADNELAQSKCLERGIKSATPGL